MSKRKIPMQINTLKKQLRILKGSINVKPNPLICKVSKEKKKEP
jgi:hypothetical protein